MIDNGGSNNLSGLWIPAEIMKIRNISATQKMILGLAASLRKGLRLSNTKLATLLGIDRRNTIRNIQQLRKKGYLIDAGPDLRHRILLVDSDKLTLSSSGKTPPIELSAGSGTVITTGSGANGKKHPKVVAQLSPINNKRNNLLNNKHTSDSDEFRLSELLLNLILQRKPDFKKPNLQKWSVHLSRLLRIDGRTVPRVEEVIRWCQNDSGNGSWGGWQDNILSTAKLRKHFDRLELSMDKKGNFSGRTEQNFNPAGQFIR